MGHSCIRGKNGEVDVRDSTFELILEWMLDELEALTGCSKASEQALRLVIGWTEYWREMPPGCKEIDLCALGGEEAVIMSDIARRALRRASPGSETELLGNRFVELLDGQLPARSGD